MATLQAFFVTTGAALAFALGGTMVFSTSALALARAFPLVVVFSASTFLLVCIAIQDLLPRTERALASTLWQLQQHEDQVDLVPSTFATALSQCLGMLALALGIGTTYAMDALARTCTEAASDDFDDDAPTRLVSRGSLVQLDRVARRCSAPDGLLSGLASVVSQDYSNRCLSEMEAPTGRGKLAFNVLAMLLHHLPEGVVLYMAMTTQLYVGVVVGIGVALHSFPDGAALASSMYFATGSRWRGLAWCALSVVGKLLGATSMWLVFYGLRRAQVEEQVTETVRAVLTGIAAGIMVAIGVKDVLPVMHRCGEHKSHGTVLGVILGMLLLGGTTLVASWW